MLTNGNAKQRVCHVSCFIGIILDNPHKNLKSQYCHSSHFTEKETEALRYRIRSRQADSRVHVYTIILYFPHIQVLRKISSNL